VTPSLTISEDNFFEITKHYLDTGQFGVVPIFAPFNYEKGYTWKPYSFNFDAIYSSGLRAGFGDTEQLPNVFQVNVSAQRAFQVPGLGQLIDRISILNLFDRTNLIRPSEGIGIFQSAYGPRFTILNTISLQF
jgi:hypothetical protein